MNAQFLITGSLRVYMLVLQPVFGRLFMRRAGVFAIVMLSSALWVASATAEDYDIIIEKNLFHNKRQKWEMEKSQTKGASSQAGSKDLPGIDTIGLFGTVIKDSQSYAVMRVIKPSVKSKSSRRSSRSSRKIRARKRAAAQAARQDQNSKRPYAVGDFINGYQIVEIHTEKVLLQDPYDDKSYEIFMNDSPSERSVVRTEIPEKKVARPSQAAEKKRKSPGRSKKASPTEALRKRFERNLKQMRDKKNDAVERQAERNWQRLQPMMESLDDKDREELDRLKNEFEKLRK